MLVGAPLLAVDVGSGTDLPPVPPWLPCVVVAVTGSRPALPAPAAADVALTEAADPPLGWVTVADAGDALGAVQQAVTDSPQAAVVLVQLLRCSARPVAEGLVAESLAYSTLQGGPVFRAWLAGRRSSPRKEGAGPPLLADRHGYRLRLTLNRPHVRNAVDVTLRDALCEALSMVALDRSIAEVHVGGAGPSFCSGGDLHEFGTAPEPATAHVVRTAHSPARLLASVADRVTVHLHGACAGAGVELAAFAGRVVAAPGTTLRLPEVSLGLVPGAGGTVSVRRRAGRQRAAWMALTGSTVDAATALRWGLVDDVTPLAGSR